MRAIWTGAIAFGLVNIPIKLYSAVEDSSLDLDMLDRNTGANIKFKRVNEDSGKEVPWDQIVKGYQLNDRYIILEDEDFEAASPKKTKLIEIEAFVQEVEIDEAYYENPYFIEPASGGAKAYRLLYEALDQTGKVGLARFVMRMKEHLAIVRTRENYLMLQQLRFHEELRTPDELNLPGDTGLSQREISVALELINQYSEPLKIEKYKDEYKKELMKIIKAKAAGKSVKVKKMEVQHTQTDDLFEQLRASLSKSKKQAS